MSDTSKTIMRNQGSRKQSSLFLVERKPTARAFTTKTRKEILFRYAWQEQEPERIAQQFSRGPVRVTSKTVNEVIREQVRAAWGPEKEAA